MGCIPIRDRIKEAGLMLLKNEDFVNRTKLFYDTHPAVKYLGNLEMFQEYAAMVAVGYYQNKSNSSKIVIDTKIDRDFIDSLDMEKLIDIKKYRIYSQTILKYPINDVSLLKLKDTSGKMYYPVKGNEQLYRQYGLIDKNGKLKNFDYPVALNVVKNLNDTTNYTWKVKKSTQDNYVIVITGVKSNVEKSRHYYNITEGEYIPLSKEQVEQLKDSVGDFLIKDGDYIFPAYKQKEIINSVGALVYSLLIETPSGKRLPVSVAFKQIKDELKKVKAYYEKILNISQNSDELLQELKDKLIEKNRVVEYNTLSNFKDITQIQDAISDIDTILKDNVWLQVEKHVKKNLQRLGITVKKDTLEEFNDYSEILDAEDLDSVESVIENDFSNEKNYSLDTFHLNPKNTTTISVKLFLSQIPSGKISYLGTPLYVPFDTVFDELKRLLSKVNPDINSYIETLEKFDVSEKLYLRAVADKLKDTKVPIQFKNQFIATMNAQENTYLLLLWGINSKNEYSIKVINANRNSAYIRILEGWNEQLKSSQVALNEKGGIILNTKRLIELKNKMVLLQKRQNASKEEYVKLMYEILNSIGISTTKVLDRVLLEDDYSKFGTGIKLKGNFKSQFHFTKQEYPSGVYSALIDSLIKVSRELEKPENSKLTLDDINPYIRGGFTHGYVTALSKLFAEYSEVLASSSYRGADGKIRYVYSFHTPITKRVKELNSNNSNLRERLSKIPFSKRAFWLRDENRYIPIEVAEFDAMKEEYNKGTFPRERTGMGKMEHDFLTANLFFGSMERSRGTYMSMTLSDKKRSYILIAPKLTIRINPKGILINDDNEITINSNIVSDSVKTYIYDIVDSELSRMRGLAEAKIKATQNATSEQEKEKILQELKKNIGKQFYEGANYFYLYPGLNRFIYDEKGNFLLDRINDPDTVTKIKRAAFEYVVKEINDTIDSWISNDLLRITTNPKTKEIKCSSIINNTYLNTMEGDDLTKTIGAITNMVINYHINNASSLQMLYGDPALSYNPDKFNSLPIPERVKSTLEEHQKRGAKDMAPGELGNTNWVIQSKDKIYKGQDYYRTVFIEDDTQGSITPGFTSTLEEYTKKLNRTDAQELTTVLEHINILMNHGKISEQVYTAIREKIEKAGPGGYYELTDEEVETLTTPIILQPQKPVQVDYIQEELFERIYYIKTSSFPLIPELTANMEIDKLRVAMEKKGVDRVVFSSGVKLGAHNVVRIFNPDGTISDDLTFNDDEIHILNRDNFYIQQDIPYREDKDEIVVSSQMDRLIVSALEEMSDELFNLKGVFTEESTSISGKDLSQLKELVRVQLMQHEKDILYSRLGINVTYNQEQNNYNVEYKDINKFSEALIELAREEGWNSNDLAALKVKNGKFILSPGLGNAYEKIESLINSLITKTIRIHINGKSFVQGASSGFKNSKVKSLDELSNAEKKGIVWVKNNGNEFNPPKGLTFITKDDKKVSYAQILLPWKFKDSISNFIDPETNTIDLSKGKIDPEILKIVGYRLPNHGYSSQLVLEIVGFLPKEVGDLAIVPGEITQQMGSDFDVDKLYTYIYNHVVNEQGNMVKISGFINSQGVYLEKKADAWIKKNFPTKSENLEKAKKLVKEFQEASNISTELLKAFEEDLDIEYEKIKPQDREILDQLGLTIEDIRIPKRQSVKKMSLQNVYIAIHEAILSNPKVVELVVEPLESEDLKQTANDVLEHREVDIADTYEEPFISRNRQYNDYIKQRSGQVGVSFYSRASVGTAIVSPYNLHLTNSKGEPITYSFFADDNGNALKLGKVSRNGKSNFKGKERTGGKNLVILQSGAVDNAKTPVLFSNNLNSNTFSASLALNVLTTYDGKGLDLRYTSYFLNQPIIFEFLEEYEKNISSLGDNSMNSITAKDIAYNRIVSIYSSRIKEKIPDWDISSIDSNNSAFTPKQLLSFLEVQDRSSVEFLENQIRIVDIFITLDTIGQSLMKLYRLLGVESKGIPINYWQLSELTDTYWDLLGNNFFSGVSNILNSTQTKYIIDTLHENKAVLEKLFPVNSIALGYTMDQLETLSGKPLTPRVKREVWLAFRSYMYSNLDLFSITDEYKKELLVGDNSLVSRIKKFMDTEEGKQFTLLKMLEFKKSADNSLPDLILYRASSSERVDEYEKVKYFIDMLISDNPTAIGIAKDLITYAYIIGGNQEALQFVKFIPIEYLNMVGFGDKVLRLFDNQSDEKTIYITFFETFLEQYLQHNPSRAFRVDNKNPSLNYDEKTGIVKINTSDVLVKHDGFETSSPYIAFYHRKTKTRKLFKLLKLEADISVYEEIPLLGGTGRDYNIINEYKYGTFNRKSLFSYNNVTSSYKTVESTQVEKKFDKELAQKIQDKLQKLYPEIKLNITNNPIWEQGDNIFNQKEYINQINYRLRATEIVLNNLNKIKQWESNKSITQDTLWKKIGELGIPKQQLDLLRESDGNTIEKKLVSFISNYSYIIKIDTSLKEHDILDEKISSLSIEEFDNLPVKSIIEDSNNEFLDIKYEIKEFEDKVYKVQIVEGKRSSRVYEFNKSISPTQYYSMLTVPGGINYTENEISIPLITPSIKGHPKFATDKGIGWFRSDDKVNGGKIYNVESNASADNIEYIDEEGQPVYKSFPKTVGGQITKTRRILEIQSDLFQKGRDKNNLTKGVGEDESFLKAIPNTEDELGIPDYEKDIERINKNSFLQLLNKDNNWVTFFIKSIIQDSAKKGYEKVLFPKGETAAKIEGHETIANEIRKIDNQIVVYKNTLNDKKQLKEDAKNLSETIGGTVDENLKSLEEIQIRNINELEQRKAELKSQGIEKIKPIEAFYEIKIGNILEKQFGKDNVKIITDEYGNQWREITINQARDLSDILLQRNEVNQIIGQANIKALTVLIDAANQKQDTLPHEYAHHYIAWFRDTAIVQEAIKKWGSEEALVQSIGEQAVKQKGEAWNWWNKFVKWIMNQFNSLSKLRKEHLTKILTDAFLTRTNLRDFEKSIINSNSPINTQRTIQQSSADKVFKEIKNGEPFNSDEYFNSLKRIFESEPDKLLQDLKDSMEIGRFKEIVDIILSNKDILKNLRVEIISAIDSNISGSKIKPTGMYRDGTIYLAKDNIIERANATKLSPKRLTEKALVHEMVHLAVTGYYDQYRNNPNSLPKSIRENFDNLSKIYQDSLNNLSQEELNKVKLIKQGKLTGMSNSEVSSLYGFTNGNEFMAEALTNATFQTKLNSIKLKNQILLERFLMEIVNLFKNLAKTLNIKVESNSSLEAALLETLDLIHNIQENITSGIKDIEVEPKLTTENIEFQEDQSIGYKSRTIKNASADTTIAIAVDFNTAGEKLTKNAVKEQGKLYIPVNANNLEITEERVNYIVDKLNSIEVANKGQYKWARYSNNSYEVSSTGDKRFSALYAKLKDGRTIEEAYQLDIKGYRSQGNNWRLGKGKAPINNISKEQQWKEYKQLWRIYLNENPQLLEELKKKTKDKTLTDKFASTDISQARALSEILSEEFNQEISLNITGNEIYTIKDKYTQQQVDDFTYNLLKAIVESPNLKVKITSIRTGGQTGFDEAGAKAGQRLGIKTVVLAPKNFTFRDVTGKDISDERLFKERFFSKTKGEEDITVYDDITTEELSDIERKDTLGMSVTQFMRTLPKDQRVALRNLIVNKELTFICK